MAEQDYQDFKRRREGMYSDPDSAPEMKTEDVFPWYTELRYPDGRRVRCWAGIWAMDKKGM